METTFLKSFVLVAETGSMAEAARRQAITPAAVANMGEPEALQLFQAGDAAFHQFRGAGFVDIQAGHADVMITGGTEAGITPMCVASFDRMKECMADMREHGGRASSGPMAGNGCYGLAPSSLNAFIASSE